MLEERGGVGGRDLDFVGGEEAEVVAGRRDVLDRHVEVLVREEAHLLRDVRADERQVRLRLEAGHERTLAGSGVPSAAVAGARRRVVLGASSSSPQAASAIAANRSAASAR